MFLSEIVDTVILCFGQAYPNLVEKQDYIKKVISIEEERFYATIDQGMLILMTILSRLRRIILIF